MKWKSHNFIFFPDYKSNMDTQKNLLIIDAPCIAKILIECLLAYYVPDMCETTMLKMSKHTCVYVVFFLEEINHATVLGR